MIYFNYTGEQNEDIEFTKWTPLFQPQKREG